MSPHRISELNDIHRQSIPTSKTIISRGVDRLWPIAISEIIEKVRNFDDFNSDNNPYGERDYGSFIHDGENIYYKIDYYDQECQFGSEDPSDSSKTSRLLTIALLSEW